MKKKINAWNITMFVFLAVAAVCVLYPLIFTLSASFADPYKFSANPFKFYFDAPENYAFAWDELKGSLFNSTMIAVISVVGNTLITCMVSYAIGVLQFKGAKLISIFMLSGMFLTSEVTSIPRLIMMNEAGFTGTVWALIIPYVFTPGGMSVILMSNFMKRIPHEIKEAALLDGAGVKDMFFRVILPLSKPMIAFSAIQHFIGVWNDFLWPLISLGVFSEFKTLPLAAMGLKSLDLSMYTINFAGLVIIFLPTLLIYAFFSKYFLEGATVGAVKG